MAVKFYEVAKIKREAMGLDQKAFAESVGVTATTISKFENGNLVSEPVIKCIKHAIADLESKLSDFELGNYKIRCATELVIAETDNETKIEKLNNLVFAATRYTKAIIDQKKGFIK